MAVPVWLHWLLPLEPNQPSRLDVLDGVGVSPRPDLPAKEVTEEDIAAFLSVWREAVSNITEAISTVRLRKFIEDLPTPTPLEAAPAWHPTSRQTEQS